MRTLQILLIICASISVQAQPLLDSLDAAIAERPRLIEKKQDHINYLRTRLAKAQTDVVKLSTIEDLFNEYYAFQFDSALHYADRGLVLAKQLGDKRYTSTFTIDRSKILAIGGLYNEAILCLDSLDTRSLEPDQLFDHRYAYFTIYSYWSDYCHDVQYAGEYRALANGHLREAIRHADARDPLYDFYMGEYHVYVEPDLSKARGHYLKALERSADNSRARAMTCFALAGNYRAGGDEARYEEYLTLAAINDLKSSTTENLALQELASFLFEKGEEHLNRAENYINQSMADAKFYDNRLRILEIAQILPQIMTTHRASIEKRNTSLRYAIGFIMLLAAGLAVLIVMIHRKNRQLSRNRHELADTNEQLSQLNRQLAQSNTDMAELNEQMSQLNNRLLETNTRREGLASIYIDLCARYIDKLNAFQTLVKRKIKAGQAGELLQAMASARISGEDAATFLTRFDKAFIDLYPTFVTEFNNLLQPDARITLKSAHTLNTELRTFALIRLGVTSTIDIAGLLFLSPQTIYNCRSAMMSKAIDMDTFISDVRRLCTVIPT